MKVRITVLKACYVNGIVFTEEVVSKTDMLDMIFIGDCCYIRDAKLQIYFSALHFDRSFVNACVPDDDTKTETNNHIPQTLRDVVTCYYPW